MKKTTIKQLLFTFALLLGGASSAWADPTTIYERKVTDGSLNESTSATDASALWSTNDIYNSSVDVTTGGWTGDTGNTSIDATNGLKISVGSKGGEKSISKTLAISSNVILTVDAVLYDPTSETQSYNNYCYFQIGSGLRFQYSYRNANIQVKADEVTKHTVGSLTRGHNWAIHAVINTAENKITALTVAGTDILDVLSVSDISLADLSTYTQLSLGTSSTNYANAFCLKEVTVQQEIQAVATYGYTVNYKVGETLVKQVVVADGGEGARTVGSSIPVITAFNGDNMTGNGGKDYSGKRYVLDADAPVQTVTTTAANNVLNVSVREKYSTTLTVTRYFDGVAEDTPYINGTALVETDEKVATWTYVFPYVVKKDDKYYVAELKEGKFGETGSFTTTPIVKTVNYTLDETIVYFSDHGGEGTNINYSNGAFDNYWRYSDLGAVDAGTYEMTVIQQAGYGTHLYKSTTTTEENRITTFESGGERTQVITLDEDLEHLYLHLGSNGRMDYILLRKIESVTVPACDALGYTFSSKYPLDFTGKDINAYIATYTSGDVVTLQKVNKVPANTGLFIKSSSSLSNVSIPTTTAATDNVTGNVLVAQSTTGKVAQSTDTKTNYVLGLVSGTPTFLKVPTAGQEVAAGKAYLSINYSASPARMAVVFEDEATGISDATHLNDNGKTTNANYYDLSGRRVAQPTKGLYIVNGKKVVIK